MHAKAISETWSGLPKESFYTVAVSVASDGAGIVRLKPNTMPVGMSLQFGEMLYQLRAALDGAIYAAAIQESGQDPPPNKQQLEFPICTSKAHFQDPRRDKLGKLSEKRRAIVEAVQPYHRATKEDSGLWVLNELARIDRHRRIHLVALWSHGLRVTFPEGTPEIIEDLETAPSGYLKRERDVASLKVRNWTPETRLHPEVDAAFSIGIDQIPNGQIEPVANLMIASVVEVVRLIENSFQD